MKKSKFVIISRYDEDVSWVNNLNCDYIIYNKGEEISISSNSLPNIGREAHTYINYIIENYYNLPDVIAFVQGNPFHHCSDIISKINSFNSDIEILCDDIRSNNDGQKYMNEFSNDLFNETCEVNKFGCGAQYIIKKEFITNKSYEWWNKCLIYFSEDLHSFFESKQSRDTEVPHIFERTWVKIWNYKNEK